MSDNVKQQRRQLIVQMFERIDGGKWDDLAGSFADDCRYERPGYEPVIGWPALRHFYEHVRIIDCGRHTINISLGDDDCVMVMGSFEGTLKDGSNTQVEFADYYELAGDQIRVRKTYFHTPYI